MKKIIVPITMITASIIIILSCNKTKNDLVSLNNPIFQADQNIQTLEQRILAYKIKITSNLKTESTIPIDSAVRYTEALVNYTYADVSNNLEGLSVDSVYITVPLTNGQVSTLQASYAYDKIIDSLTVQNNNLPAQNRHLVFADVYSKDSTSGSVRFGIISAFGYGDLINYGPFGENDWWMFGYAWANSGGYCAGEYQGTHTDDDAAGQIERRIRLNIGVPSGRKSPTDVVTLQIIPNGDVTYIEESESFTCDFDNTDDDPPLDNYLDYLLMYKYSGIQQNFDPCLSPTEMNSYWHGTSNVCIDVLYYCDEIESLIAGKVFMSIIIYGENDTGNPNYHYQHRLLNTYGVWLTNPNPPEQF